MTTNKKVYIWGILMVVLFIVFLCINTIIFTKTSRYEKIYDSASIGMDEDGIVHLFDRNFQIESSKEGLTYCYYLNLGCDTDFQDFIKVHFKDGIVVEKEAIVFEDSSFFDKSLKERYFSTFYFFPTIGIVFGLLSLAFLLFFMRNKLLNSFGSIKNEVRFHRRFLVIILNLVLLIDLICLGLFFIFDFLDIVCILLA